MAFYLDTSALMRLVVAEAESEPLRAWLAADDRDPVSSGDDRLADAARANGVAVVARA